MKCTTKIYTDEYKMDCGVGTAIYSQDLDISISFRLADSASIFQAEVVGIEKAGGGLLNNYG